jgi:hypothetical protein
MSTWNDDIRQRSRTHHGFLIDTSVTSDRQWTSPLPGLERRPETLETAPQTL